MRVFIVLALVVAASAGLLPSGYNYGVRQNGGEVVSNLGYQTSSNLVGSHQVVGTVGTSNSGFASNGNSGSYRGGVSSTGGQRLASNVGTTLIGLSALDSVPQTVEYSKQFYHFTAPEEEQQQGITRQQLSNVLKKNLQVVFIKAPENNAATNAALQLAKQAIEQRTAIYVLSKENDAAQVVGQLEQIQENVQTTPVVRFIRYRTPQDIDYAKETIRSQYDNFGGESQNFDGGVAPVLNYASNAGASEDVNVNFVSGSGSLGGSAGSANFGSNGASLGGSSATVNYVSGGSLGASSVTGSGLSQTTLVGGNRVVSNTNTNYLPPAPLK